MREYTYHLLNVFAIPGQRLSGNPLCVFENAEGLSDEEMQALTLQFNLSESTFILPSDQATAHVRIFTPTFEMPFAGHPTLGTSQIVRKLKGIEQLTLQMKAGIIPVSASGDNWTLQVGVKPTWRAAPQNKSQFAEMLEVSPGNVIGEGLWCNAGVEQLVIPLDSPGAVKACNPDPALLKAYGELFEGRCMAYVFAPQADGTVLARFFFLKGPSVIEDPATGSACTNLGVWHLANNKDLPVKLDIYQGAQTGRPSKLGLKVDTEQNIFATGHVIHLATGTLWL